jgi:hypothetical protein
VVAESRTGSQRCSAAHNWLICAPRPTGFSGFSRRQIRRSARSTMGRDPPCAHCPRWRTRLHSRRGDSGGCPRWPSLSQVQRPRIRLDNHWALPSKLAGRSTAVPCGPGSGLSFGLIHPVRSRSRANADRLSGPVQVCSRPVVDGGTQSTEACFAGRTPEVISRQGAFSIDHLSAWSATCSQPGSPIVE